MVLVRAEDRDEAVSLAEDEFRKLPHDRVAFEAGYVVQLGTLLEGKGGSRVLLEPVITPSRLDFECEACWIRHYEADVEWTDVTGLHNE